MFIRAFLNSKELLATLRIESWGMDHNQIVEKAKAQDNSIREFPSDRKNTVFPSKRVGEI